MKALRSKVGIKGSLHAGQEGGTQTSLLHQWLRTEILACRLKPGEKLRIAALTGRLSVSPGSVREALSRLVSEGLVIAESQRGFHVTPISSDELLDLTNARAYIETTCLER